MVTLYGIDSLCYKLRMIYEFDSYRSILKNMLVERIQKNPAYSLRSMAKSLGIAASQLSSVFSGKKNLSVENGMRIAAKLGLDSREQEYFSLLIQFELAEGMDVKRLLRDRIQSMNSLRDPPEMSLEILKIASEWYHIPIVVMAELANFKGESRTISKRLGISKMEAELAVNRLLRVGMLERMKDGSLRNTNLNCIFRSQEANEGLRTFHKQMLQKAMHAIENQSNEEKAVGSETFTFDSNQLKKMNLLMEDFFKQASRMADSGKEKNNVYHLGVQFFRVTNEERQA